MKKFWLVTVPRVVLGLIFLAGAIDGFSFIFTGTHLLHPPHRIADSNLRPR